jgi:hypothetical protein
MRLEPLFRISMQYADATWMRQFGGAEGAGFGQGEGTASGGGFEGTVRWANFPRRREDGVWTPNLRGVVTLADGAELLMSIHGQSVEEAPASRGRRAILARIELLAEDDRYRWLNTSFLVAEGEIDEEKEVWWLDAFVCVNEVAAHPPGIGSPPPERFRQGA